MSTNSLYVLKSQEKEKKPRSEAQKAAFAKAQEARKRKREEREQLENDIKVKQEEIDHVGEEIKKIKQKKKKAKKVVVESSSSEEEMMSAASVTSEEIVVHKPVKIIKKEKGAPQWFIEHQESKKLEKAESKAVLERLNKLFKKHDEEEKKRAKQVKLMESKPEGPPPAQVPVAPKQNIQRIDPTEEPRKVQEVARPGEDTVYRQIFPGR
jgi:hypothetical protein